MTQIHLRRCCVLWMALAGPGLAASAQTKLVRATRLLTVRPAPARQPAASPTSVIAVIDLVRVFDEHPYFRSNIAATQRQVREFERLLSARKQSISRHSKQLNELATDSPEYRRMEASLLRDYAQLRVWTNHRQQELTRQKAVCYCAAYRDIIAATARVAQHQHIALVLRISVAPSAPTDPGTIAQAMNRSIILQRNLDITQQVIDDLHAHAAPTRSTDPPPADSRPLASIPLN